MKSRNTTFSGKRKLISNIVYAFLAQGISLLLSMVMSLIIPKILGIEEFSYWQLFIFYVGYVGFFHFGLNDGIYLRVGGSRYQELDYSLLGTQFKISIVLQTVMALIIVLVGCLLVNSSERQMIIMCTGIYLVISNATLYLGFIFQAVNRIKIFSISVIVDRVLVLLSVIILIVIGTKTFEPFVVCYIASKFVALIYCVAQGKEIVFANRNKLNISFEEIWINISVGIKLMIANIASMLILGSGRMVIDVVWGIEAFGEFSLALSLTSFVLLFISQISMVLFPSLRRLDEEKQRKVYEVMRNIIGLLLPLVFLLYVPMKALLGLWLPQYKESLNYLALLLPLCTFDGKMQLLCNTYFKVLRKEGLLLKYNCIAFALSLLLSLIGGYAVKNIYFIVVSLVLAIAVRSIISEMYLANTLGIKVGISILQEILLVLIFWGSSWFLPNIVVFTVVMISYIVYLMSNAKKIRLTVSAIRNLHSDDNEE